MGILVRGFQKKCCGKKYLFGEKVKLMGIEKHGELKKSFKVKVEGKWIELEIIASDERIKISSGVGDKI